MMTHAEKLVRIEKLIREKSWWLGDFSRGKSKRPDHEIDDKRRDLEALEAVAADYRKSINRKAEGEAA